MKLSQALLPNFLKAIKINLPFNNSSSYKILHFFLLLSCSTIFFLVVFRFAFFSSSFPLTIRQEFSETLRHSFTLCWTRSMKLSIKHCDDVLWEVFVHLFQSFLCLKFKCVNFNFLHPIIGKLKAEKKIKWEFHWSSKSLRDIKAHSPSYDHKTTLQERF